MSTRRAELLAVLTADWQSGNTLRKLADVPGVATLLTRLLADGVVERRGNGVVGNPYEWRLRQPGGGQRASQSGAAGTRTT